MPLSTEPLTLPMLRQRLTDEQALTFTLYGEGRGEPIEGRIAIGCVVRNRVAEHRQAWGESAKTVCLAHAQFSCWYPWGGEENHQHLLGLVSALLFGGPVPWSDRERHLYTECAWVTEGILSGFVLDRVKGATHYYAPAAMPEGRVPDWAKGHEPVAVIGRHLFFKGIR
jgi:hypothetical protein